jgi:hypothetical protein
MHSIAGLASNHQLQRNIRASWRGVGQWTAREDRMGNHYRARTCDIRASKKYAERIAKVIAVHEKSGILLD